MIEDKAEKSTLGNNGRKLSKFGKRHEPKDSKSWVNHKKSRTRHLILKPLNTKCQEKIMKSTREKWQHNYRAKPVWMTMDFSSESLESRRKPESFSSAARRELATQNPVPSKNVLQEFKEKWIQLQKKKTKNLSNQTYPKRVARGSSLNRKQMIKERTLKYREGRKNTVNKR